ncbi:MAG: hypothetical protein Q8O88_06280 [bacterium]|nr:hypothetical protein [bacterium]
MTLSSQEIQNRKDHLLSIGLSEEKIAKIAQTRPSLYSKNAVDSMITGLKEKGFANPEKMIIKFPVVLNLSFENIDGKIAGLKEKGFANPEKMITNFPIVLNLSFENINRKIEGLRKRGFANPEKMITISAAVLGYSFENIDDKIAGLKERGFANPEKIIAIYPGVLSLSFENIDKKIKMLDKLINLYKLDLTPVKIIEANINILSSKIDKLWVLARVIRENAKNIDEINNELIRNLLFSNLESVVLAVKTGENLSLKEILAEAKKIKIEIPSIKEKRELISELPEDDMTRKRFERGYPPGKNK